MSATRPCGSPPIAREKRGGSANDDLLLLESDAGGWERIVKCGWRCGILQSPSRHPLLFHPEGDTKGANPPLTVIDTSHILSVKRCGQPSELIRSSEDQLQNWPQAISDKFAHFSGTTMRLEDFASRCPSAITQIVSSYRCTWISSRFWDAPLPSILSR